MASSGGSGNTGFRAIIPRRDPFAFAGGPVMLAKLSRELVLFGRTNQALLSQYPPQQAHITYTRTGELGRRWSIKGPKFLGGTLWITLINNAKSEKTKRGYSVWVQGPTRGTGKKQVKWAARYGWLSVTKAIRTTWPPVRLRIRRVLQGK